MQKRNAKKPTSKPHHLAAWRFAIRLAMLIFAAFGGEPASAWGAEASRPNIVFILADDMGYGDVRCLDPQFSKIPTPHIDRLAREGMTFADAHSGSSVCTPTRYGLMTGRYAWRTRLQSGVLAPYAAPLIAANRLTLPGLLANNGYRTACIGKWHLGWKWPKADGKVVFDRPIAEGPTTRGFDYYFGTDVPNNPPYGFIENARLAAQPTEWFSADPKMVLRHPGPMVPGWRFDRILPRLVEKAVEYVGRQASRNEPFFLYFPLTIPHEPIAPSAEFQGKSGISPVGDLIMETDWAVGQIVQALEKSDAAENTLLIFAADNGHCAYTGLQPFFDAGHRVSQRFRGFKFDIWEGGHRVPFIARWPGQVKPGSECHQTICLTDLLATCADLLGTKLPDNAGEDSVSILPALKGSTAGPRHEAIVHHSSRGRFSIRQENWKLELCAGSGGTVKPTDDQASQDGLPAVQLYDMSQDDAEKINLQDKYPEVVARLTNLLEKYVAEGRSTPGAPQKNDVPVKIRK
jgi:arylsulfatase A